MSENRNDQIRAGEIMPNAGTVATASTGNVNRGVKHSVQPTPVPWFVGPHYRSDIESHHGHVAECGITRGEQAIVNAAHIVRCVNAYPELIAALKECGLRLGALCLASGDFSDANAKALDMANAALAKAEAL